MPSPRYPSRDPNATAASWNPAGLGRLERPQFAGHHRPPRELGEALGRVIIAGESLASVDEEEGRPEPLVRVTEALDAAGLRDANVDGLLREMQREINQLGAFLEIDG